MFPQTRILLKCDTLIWTIYDTFLNMFQYMAHNQVYLLPIQNCPDWSEGSSVTTNSDKFPTNKTKAIILFYEIVMEPVLYSMHKQCDKQATRDIQGHQNGNCLNLLTKSMQRFHVTVAGLKINLIESESERRSVMF